MNIEERTARFHDCVEKLKKQGQRSVEASFGGCQYRGKAGTKCAVGMYIPDEIYDKKMECGGIPNLLDSFPGIREILNIENALDELFYYELQKLHDASTPFMNDRSIKRKENYLIKLDVINEN